MALLLSNNSLSSMALQVLRSVNILDLLQFLHQLLLLRFCLFIEMDEGRSWDDTAVMVKALACAFVDNLQVWWLLRLNPRDWICCIHTGYFRWAQGPSQVSQHIWLFFFQSLLVLDLREMLFHLKDLLSTALGGGNTFNFRLDIVSSSTAVHCWLNILLLVELRNYQVLLLKREVCFTHLWSLI